MPNTKTSQEKDEINSLESRFGESLNQDDVDSGIDQLEQHANNGGFNYRPTGDQGKSSGLGGFLKRNRLKLIIGGGGGGLLIALFSLAAIFITPFKLDFFSQNVQQSQFLRLSHIFDARSARFINSLVAADIAGNKSGENSYFVAKGWIASQNPFVQLYKNWSVANFEQKLEDEQGIRFIRQRGTDGIDRLVQIDVKGIPFDFKDLLDKNGVWTGDPKFLDERIVQIFNTNKAGRQALNDAIASVTRSHQILQRRHLRLWAREALGVNKWSFFENTQEKVSTAVRQKWNQAVESYFNNGNFYRCLFSLECPTSEDLNASDNEARMVTPTEDNISTGSQQALDETAQAEGGATDTKAGEAIANEGTKLVATDTMKEIAGKVMTIVNPIATIANWANNIKQVDALLGGTNSGLKNLVAVARATEYASSFMTFSTLVDQAKAGLNVSPQEIDAAVQMFDGAENSDGYQTMVGNGLPSQQQTSSAPSLLGKVYAASGGTSDQASSPYAAVTDNLKVSSDGSEASQLTAMYNNTFGAIIHPIVQYLLTCTPSNPIGCLISFILSAINKVLGLLGNLGATVFRGLDNLITGGKIQDGLALVVGKFAEFLGGAPACTGNETGGQLMNCIVGGGRVTESAFLKSAGGVPLTDQQTQQLTQAGANEEQLSFQNESTWQRLTSLNDSRSLVAQAVMYLPSDRHELFSSLSSFATSLMPGNWFSGLKHTFVTATTPLSQQVYATSSDNIFGIKQYGFTADQLNTDPFNNESASQCAAETQQFDATLASGQDATSPSLCKLDTIVANSLSCLFTNQDDCGINDSSDGTQGP